MQYDEDEMMQRPSRNSEQEQEQGRRKKELTRGVLKRHEQAKVRMAKSSRKKTSYEYEYEYEYEKQVR